MKEAYYPASLMVRYYNAKDILTNFNVGKIKMQYKFTETDYIDQQKSLNLELQKDYPFCCNKKWCPNGCGKKVTKVQSVFTYQKNLWKCKQCEKYFLRTKDEST